MQPDTGYPRFPSSREEGWPKAGVVGEKGYTLLYYKIYLIIG